jgi:hypothetical protein
MAHLLRYRQRVTDLVLPNGKRVKVTVNETANVQHVEDTEGRIHATVRPDPIVLVLHRDGEPAHLREDRGSTNGRHWFVRDEDMGLWAPLPEEG